MTNTPPENKLICAYDFDGTGTAKPIGWDEITAPPSARTNHFRWIHLQHQPKDQESWLTRDSKLDRIVIDALLAPETRPRCTAHDDGAILNLRGINLNAGADPEDMVSLRLWIEPQAIVSVRLRKLMAIEDLCKAIDDGRSPKNPGEFVSMLAFKLTDRMEPEIMDLSDRIDELEDRLLAEKGAGADLRREIGDMRRMAVILRRYVAPQRDALNSLSNAGFSFVHETNRMALREAADRVTRMVEELDAVRERAVVLHDQLTDRRAEEMNRNMLVLSIAAAVFLPLTFVSGLLGMNVGGIPWASNPSGFAIILAVCAALAAGLVWLFRRLRWI